MEELDRKIGVRLKQLRETHDYTMREVADRTGIHYTYVGKIEKGQIPSLDKLKKLCDLYGISVASLFGEEIEVPEELQELGVKWVTFAKDMQKQGLSPEEIQNWVKVIKSLNVT